MCVHYRGGVGTGMERWMDGWMACSPFIKTTTPSETKQQELVFECPSDEHCVLALKVNSICT